MFVTVTHIHPSQIFDGKVYPLPIEFTLRVESRKGKGRVEVTDNANTLAYYDAEIITGEKVLSYKQPPVDIELQLFDYNNWMITFVFDKTGDGKLARFILSKIIN